jgi:hypothetical protein
LAKGFVLSDGIILALTGAAKLHATLFSMVWFSMTGAVTNAEPHDRPDARLACGIRPLTKFLRVGNFGQRDHAFTRISPFIVGCLLLGVCAAKGQEARPAPLVINPSIVWSNSVVLAANQQTNVSLHFRFRNKSPDAVREIVRQYQGKKISIACGGATVAHATVTGVLVDERNDPVGLMLVFETRAEARKAKSCLTSRTGD